MFSGPKSRSNKEEHAESKVDTEENDKAKLKYFTGNLASSILRMVEHVKTGGMTEEKFTEVVADEVEMVTMRVASEVTPMNLNKMLGVEDDFANYTAMERSELVLGFMTDDQLANGAFMNYDVRPPISDIIAGIAYSPISWLTATKERIRWLSRRVSETDTMLAKLHKENTGLIGRVEELEAELKNLKADDIGAC